ncbi:type II toxin-antitoxin system Phd/YefM family antitoxin [Clostridium sp. CS001]|uniref:type II toxin-antitoxin system Phd/YefM family antitoxin n=1 Tax=Clostridium sp. CS001 TaxID=2880648 RepID=UPI001CF0DD2C|nr:type II toxin-antitoxin system Phd/YefM family antitoxin [Clostridium sp. CS001]MCB2291868.1 type II toxin-antitoxin system Phd/YefM family antitoxin [Clostridium sp. CS001]
MPIIRPISDLRNNFNMISDICHTNAEPIFITKNGHGNMVIMSQALYEQQQALIELYQKLAEAEFESQTIKTRISHKDLMAKMRANINE